MAVQESITILSRQRIERIINRIAFQIIEDNTTDLPVFIAGIDQRGFALSKLLKDKLENISGKSVPVVHLPVKKTGDLPNFKHSENSFCILFDDVVFSGITLFNALIKLLEHTKPNTLKVAVLVDRGHRQYPIEAHYKGIVSPTKLNEHVRCIFNENDLPYSVVLEHK